MISKIINKIKALIKLSRIVSVDDANDVRIGNVRFLGKDQNVTVFSPYGLMHNPPVGSIGPMFQVDGNESKMIGIFDRPDQRPVKSLEEGEVAIGNYSTGDYVIFEDGSITRVVVSEASGKIVVEIGGGSNLELEGSGTGAKLTLGDGAKSVAEADSLETLYGLLKTQIDKFDTHTHGGVTSGAAFTGTPPVSTPPVSITAPSWDSNINSNKAKIPGN